MWVLSVLHVIPQSLHRPFPRNGQNSSSLTRDIGLGTLASPCTGYAPYVRARLESSTDAECKVWLDYYSDTDVHIQDFYGQYHQDVFLFYNFFRCRDGPGTYLDIGAYNPKRFSNTWFFDRCLGWKGICAEADPAQAAPFRSNRGCFLIDKAVSIAAGQGSMSGGDWGGQLMPGNPHAGGALASITTMDSVLRDAGWLSDETVGAITVDFFSLDVEEHELEVLLAVPWEKLNIRFVAIENNHATLDEEELFIGKSFVKLGGMGVDDIFARLEHPVKLWWPNAKEAELQAQNNLRRDRGYKPYKHPALYRGWSHVLAGVKANNAIPKE